MCETSSCHLFDVTVHAFQADVLIAHINNHAYRRWGTCCHTVCMMQLLQGLLHVMCVVHYVQYLCQSRCVPCLCW